MKSGLKKFGGSALDICRQMLVRLGTFCIYALVLLILADVLSRNLFNLPVPGVLEVSQYWLMVPMVCIGIWWAGRTHQHVRVTMLTENLGENALKLADAIAGCAAVLGLLIVSWFSFQVAYESMLDGEYAGAYKIVIWPVRYVVALGFLSFAFVIARQLVDTLSNPKRCDSVHSENPEAL
ncbi:TRAP transporter small permease [Thalassospira sp. HF15]|uniref:TRAP transporter small permease n=1 Tax=Thalassospira sp. HF15 TaxID=2722755 RepID=UPI00142FCF75|nr:TRAP transporter small permease [Thalassospira sp. HF15]NIY76769.1 TRAP transporter small permease [Thalassospira sp. HF15]